MGAKDSIKGTFRDSGILNSHLLHFSPEKTNKMNEFANPKDWAAAFVDGEGTIHKFSRAKLAEFAGKEQSYLLSVHGIDKDEILAAQAALVDIDLNIPNAGASYEFNSTATELANTQTDDPNQLVVIFTNKQGEKYTLRPDDLSNNDKTKCIDQSGLEAALNYLITTDKKLSDTRDSKPGGLGQTARLAGTRPAVSQPAAFDR